MGRIFSGPPFLKTFFIGKFMSWLNGKKTYIVSILMLFVSLLNLITVDITLNEFISSDSMMLLLEAMGLSSLRAGIK